MSSTSLAMRQRANPEAGFTTIIEFALVLPILLMVLFGIIELANIMRTQITLNSAVSTLARQVAVDPTVRTQAAVADFMSQNGLLPLVTQTADNRAVSPTLTLDPENPICTSASCLPFKVQLTYAYYAVTPLMAPFFDGIILSATASKTAEPSSGTTLNQ